MTKVKSGKKLTTVAMKTQKEAPETALVLRTCSENMTSRRGFEWPGAGERVECTDWDSTPKCGGGLHGWLYGAGDHTTSPYLDDSAKWLVIEVELATIVMLGDKCKFRSGIVRFVGSKQDAADFIVANEPRATNVPVIGHALIVGDNGAAIVGGLGTATAGNSGTATAGDSGTATAGNYGTATAGNYGKATAGYSGKATAGYSGKATAGNSGKATAGNYGTATAGYSGTATAGYSGKATAGYSGTATAGNYGTATAGYSGTATAGYSGTLLIKWYDHGHSRYRTEIAYVGEGGIEPNVKYKLNNKHEFVRA